MRVDIQALRGFAVLSVLLYHLNFAFIPGGFLGVDIFFVISGFVITSSLLNGEGTFKQQIIAFYKRRAKRILPASLTVTLMIAIASLFFLPVYLRHRTSIQALASSLFSANLNFYREGNDYLAGAQDPSPYLHFWSLGVEEQFYLVWPILFLVIFRARRKLVAPFFVVALVAGLFLTLRDPIYGFYSPLTRAWEFLAGVYLALNPVQVNNKKMRSLISVVGWVGMITSVLVFSTANITPGYSTILPVVSTALVIAAQAQFPRWALLPSLGDYSFSLYLVHWPLIIFIKNRWIDLILALPLAYFITRYIENPFRFNKRFTLSLPKWSFSITAVSLISFSTLAFPAQAKTSLDLSSPSSYANGCHLSFGKSWPTKDCHFGAGQEKIFLVGDSHAAQWFNAVYSIAQKNHYSLFSATKSSCPTVLIPIFRNNIVDKDCATYQQKIIQQIKSEKPQLVLISAYSEYAYPTSVKGNYSQEWSSGLQKFLQAIPSTKVLFLGDTPHPPVNIPTCLSKDNKCDFPLTRTAATRATEKLMANSYVDTTTWLCPSICAARTDGKTNYRDLTHISVSASMRLIPQLEKVIKAKLISTL